MVKRIKIITITDTFDNILLSEFQNQKLFYHITPYYSHLKELPNSILQ